MSAETMVRERPILFSGPMVRAILDGAKTQTRRVVTPQPEPWAGDGWKWRTRQQKVSKGGGGVAAFPGGCFAQVMPTWCPYGQTGDRLWVRETFVDHGGDLAAMALDERVEYRAEPWDRQCADSAAGPWTPSIHMPRWASRRTLEITDVRVERLQEISEADAIAEGVYTAFEDERSEADAIAEGVYHAFEDARDEEFRVASLGEVSFPAAQEYYARLWDSINAKRGYGWDVNPWVWVLEFAAVRA